MRLSLQNPEEIQQKRGTSHQVKHSFLCEVRLRTSNVAFRVPTAACPHWAF